MKKTFKLTFLFLLALITFQSCQDQDDIAAPSNLEIQNFIWKGLNQYYLWQADVPNLADNRFQIKTNSTHSSQDIPSQKNYLML